MKEVKTNFKKLDNTKHMLKWFAKEPYEQILNYVEKSFQEQEPSTELIEFNVVSEPNWLTGGIRRDDDNDLLTVVRAGTAFLCEFILKDNYGIYNLKAVFSWILVTLDGESVEKYWIDLNGTLEEFGDNGLLKLRIYPDITD